MIPLGDDSPGEMTPRGPMVKDAALGSQRSWVRIPPPPLGPKSDRGGHECCEADFGSRIKILGHPLGQSASFFEIYLLGLVMGGLTPLTAAAIPESRLGGVNPPQQQFGFSGWGGLTSPSSTGIRPVGGYPPTAAVAAIRGRLGPGGG